MYDLLLYVLCFLGKMFMFKNDEVNALNVFRCCLRVCNYSNQFTFLPNILLNLGLILQKSRKYDSALNSVIRALEFTYYFEDKMFEVKIYDSLGKIFYERNMQDIALYYHNRAMKGQLEAMDSIKKKIAIQSAKGFIDQEKKFLTEDGFDLLGYMEDFLPCIAKESKPKD